MKKFTFIFFLFISIFAYSQSLEELDNKNGFRDIKFGIHFNDLKNLKDSLICKNEGSNKVCYSPFENLKIGEYELTQITYMFYEDILNSIVIFTPDYLNSRGVLNVFEAAYGKGKQNNRFMEKYVWYGKKVIMIYEENSITHESQIAIINLDLTRERKEKEKKLQEKAASEI